MGLLLAAVIEKAVKDRRLAVTHNLIDENCFPTGKGGKDKMDIITGLREFFFCGGLESMARAGGFDLPIKRIKEKSCEAYRR